MAPDDPSHPPAEVLRYETDLRSSGGLCLYEEDGVVVVKFPATPKWVWVALVGLQESVGLLKLGTSVAIVVALYRIVAAGPAPSAEVAAQIRRVELSVLGVGAVSALIWWGAAFYTGWAYRHGASEPKTFLADSESLVLRRFCWVRRCQTSWPVSNLAGIELHMIKGNLNWTRTVADLYVRPKQGRRKRFRLSSHDPLLPERIAQRLSAVLGVPLAHG